MVMYTQSQPVLSMNEDEILARKEKARRQTIFDKNGKLSKPQSLTKRSICNVHLQLANRIFEMKIRTSDRNELLHLVNEAYQLGKRMATALDVYKSLQIGEE